MGQPKRHSQDPNGGTSPLKNVSELLDTADLGKMEVLRKMSISSHQDLTELKKFVNLDKVYDNEERVLEFIKFLMEKNQLPSMLNHIVQQEIDSIFIHLHEETSTDG